MQKLLLIDGTALVFRAFYGIRNPMTNAQGLQTNAIYGFYNMLFNILSNYSPTHFVVAFDRSEPTQRHEEYTEYKANRSKAPDELYLQIPIIKKILNTGNLNLVEEAGYEADDIIATINQQNQNTPTQIYSGDFDLLQLLNNHTSVIIPSSKEEFIVTPKSFQEKYNLTPSQIPDYKGLSGDNSDNLPGVKGIGPKTAVQLLNKYNNLENIYKHVDELPESQKTKMIESQEIAILCKKLATLNFQTPINTNLENYKITNINIDQIKQEFETIQFKKLTSKLYILQKKFNLTNQKPPTHNNQISMF